MRFGCVGPHFQGPLLRAEELIKQVFSHSIYGPLPTPGITINRNKLSTI